MDWVYPQPQRTIVNIMALVPLYLSDGEFMAFFWGGSGAGGRPVLKGSSFPCTPRGFLRWSQVERETLDP